MNKKQVLSIILVFIVFFIYALPYLFLRQNCIISTWDNLDSYFIWYKILAQYGWFLPLNFEISELMNGVPRNVFHSELIFQVAIFNFLTPLKAYITVDLLSRFVGFLGTYLLLKDFVLKHEQDNPLLLSGISLCFAFIPNLLTLTFLTILGQPLWLWAFLNIRKGNYKYYNWLVITLIPFCVNFELITPFFLSVIGGIWLFDLITKKKFNPIFLLSIFYCAFISFITIYRFIYISFFDKNFVPHRKDWSISLIQHFSQYSFLSSILKGINTQFLNNGENCAFTATKLVITPVFLFSLIYSAYKKSKKFFLPLFGLLIFYIIVSIIYGLGFHYEPLQAFIDKYEGLKQFQFTRYYFMLPMIGVLTFAISLEFLKETFQKFGKILVLFFILSQIIYLFAQNPYITSNIRRYVTHEKISSENYTLSYKEYLSEENFKLVKDYIGKPQNSYKIATIESIPFNVAAYNGFHSINGYLNLYPWGTKQKLNKLNQELIKQHLRNSIYLTIWGHQQIILPDENSFDTNVMREMGVEYLISSKIITQTKNSKLLFLKEFPPLQDKAYPIYLYKLLDK